MYTWNTVHEWCTAQINRESLFDDSWCVLFWFQGFLDVWSELEDTNCCLKSASTKCHRSALQQKQTWIKNPNLGSTLAPTPSPPPPDHHPPPPLFLFSPWYGIFSCSFWTKRVRTYYVHHMRLTFTTWNLILIVKLHGSSWSLILTSGGKCGLTSLAHLFTVANLRSFLGIICRPWCRVISLRNGFSRLVQSSQLHSKDDAGKGLEAAVSRTDSLKKHTTPRPSEFPSLCLKICGMFQGLVPA